MPFDAYLLSLPDWLLVFILIAIYVLFAVFGLLIVHKFVHHSILKLHNDVAGFIFASLGVVYGVLLAFVVLVVWEEYNEAFEDTEREASCAFALYRDISLYPDSTVAGELRTKFKDFSKLVIQKEFPAMQNLTYDPGTVVAFRKFFYDVGRLKPVTAQQQVIYSQIMDNLNRISEYRAQRMLNLNSSIPDTIWLPIIIGSFITIGFTFLFGTENFRAQIIMSTSLSILISLVIFVILELQYPFSGDLSIQPTGYKQILEWSPLKDNSNESVIILSKQN